MKENRYTTPWQHESDAGDLQAMSDAVSEAYKRADTQAEDIDVEAAWCKFDARHHVTSRPSLWHRWGVAASIALVCFVAVALSVPALQQFWVSATPDNEPAEPAIMTAEEACVEETAQAFSYRNVPLSEIVTQLATRFDAVVDNQAAEDIRLYVVLERQWSLEECIAFLNHFEQVNITLTNDNTIEVR